MLAPSFLDVIGKEPDALPSRQETRASHEAQFGVETYLIGISKDPLSWDCDQGSRDRARYIRNTCFAEHIADFDLAELGQAGSVELIARGDAGFAAAKDGAPIRGIRQLNVQQTDSLRTLLLTELPKFPAYVDISQAPFYSSSIEACIDGKDFLEVRRVWNDAAFEGVARQVASRADIDLTRTSPNNCM